MLRVDTTGEHGVEVAGLEPLDGRVDGGHRRCACGVDGEVRTVEVEQVGDAAGDDVGQLAGHGVLGDAGEPPPHSGLHLLDDRGPQIGSERGERRCLGQLVGVLGEVHAHGRQVVEVSAHRVAQDHGGALRVERAVGVPVVGQGLTGRDDRPLLGAVHRVAHLRWDRQPPLERLPVPLANPATDLRVRLVGRQSVVVEVVVGVPAVVDLADAVALVGDVVPERGNVGRVGEDGAHADDGDGAVDGLSHGGAPLSWLSYWWWSCRHDVGVDRTRDLVHVAR